MRIAPAYLDPCSIEEQIMQIKTSEESMIGNVLNVVAGDFNFVTRAGDRIAKNMGDTCVSGDKRQLAQ